LRKLIVIAAALLACACQEASGAAPALSADTPTEPGPEGRDGCHAQCTDPYACADVCGEFPDVDAGMLGTSHAGSGDDPYGAPPDVPVDTGAPSQPLPSPDDAGALPHDPYAS
jgi:hypothetical protein